MNLKSLAICTIGVLAIAPAAAAQVQKQDSLYTAMIRALTPVDPKYKFTTELVDHLPYSATVPSPMKGLGFVVGTPGKQANAEELAGYLRSLEKVSGRIKVFSLGKSEEGREMVVAAIADEATIKTLDKYRDILAKLGDPRGLSDAQKAALIKEGKPIYWLTGSIHSTETASPDMLAELAYRLTVEESDHVKTIRNNIITLITPTTEVDGRDREVDLARFRAAHQGQTGPTTAGLVYWGNYVQHDNNRDGIGASLALTQNMLKGSEFWHPTVLHDLHESVDFMHISSGTGPYNDEFDPISVNEWSIMAYNEINELTRRGLPGVWTHNYYDGWAPNYMFSIALLRNGLGRFYETKSGGACQTTGAAGANEVEWDRTNPPVPNVRWCLRSNVNYQQSGVMIGLKYVADHKQTFLEDFVAKSQHQINRGKQGPIYAYVIPKDQVRSAEAADLVNYFHFWGAEISVANSDFETHWEPQIMGRQGSALEAVNTARVAAGNISTSVAAAGGRGRAGGGGGGGGGGGNRGAAPAATPAAAAANGRGAAAPAAGATAPANGRAGGGRGAAAATPTTANGAIDLAAVAAATNGTPAAAPAERGKTMTVHAGDWIVRMDQPYTQAVRTFLDYQHFKVTDPDPYDDTGWTLDELNDVKTYKIVDPTILTKPMTLSTAEKVAAATSVTGSGNILLVKATGGWHTSALPWQAGGKTTVADEAFTVSGQSFPVGTMILEGPNARTAVANLQLKAVAVASAPAVKGHVITLPRIAYVHSWSSTQDEGWVRLGLDQMKIPYKYMGENVLSDPTILNNYDVVIIPSGGVSSAAAALQGKPTTGTPTFWKRTAETPNLGTPDSTDDTRGSLGFEGVQALMKFVNRGGLLITEGSTTRLPVELGLTLNSVSIAPTDSLFARGSVLRADIVDHASPIVYGLDQETLSVYFNNRGGLLLNATAGGGGGRGFGGGGGGGGGRNGGAGAGTTASEAPTTGARTILRFTNSVDSLLVSGSLGNGQIAAGKATLVDVTYGKGHVVMFGMRPMWRGETKGSWPLVANAMANWNALSTGLGAATAAAAPAPAPIPGAGSRRQH